MINGSSTELSTVYTVMKKAQNICSSLQQRDMVITFDLAIYVKAKQIQWKFPQEFSGTVIRMGGFHIALNFLAVLGKKYQNSGLEYVLIESGVYAPGSVMALMKGKSYNRGVRAHKLAMGALFRLMWASFLHWLNDGGLESQEKIVDEERITDSIKSLRLAFQNQDHIRQSAEDATSELLILLELFEVFRQEMKSRSKMFDFWNGYITMVMNLLQFIKAERTGSWSLHLAATSEMVPHFYAYDRPNYARWLPVYLADMAQLEKTHPVVHSQFEEENHAVNRPTQPFAKVWTDMALEQSVNLDSKSKGGIIGISKNPDALQRWFLTSHERSAITTAVKQMCGINDSERVGTHKEAAPKRVQRDEKDVEKIVACFKSGLMKDPFLGDNDILCNIATGVVLPEEIAERLVKSKEEGLTQLDCFVQQRLHTNSVSFWDAIPNLRIKTFNTTRKKVRIPSSNEKAVVMAEDRDLFGRLLIVAKVREINLREVLSYELSAVPYSLAHSDGTLRQTAKNVLLQILENYATVHPRLSAIAGIATVYILDGIALVQMMRFAGAKTFGEMAIKYYEAITSYLRYENCHRVDVVFDQYWHIFIKGDERKQRGEANALEVKIHGESTPVPKQWNKYISNVKNKVGLCAFLAERFCEIGKRQLEPDKQLLIGEGTRDGDLALSVRNGQSLTVSVLISDHEEADTRLLLHAKHACQDGQRIVVQSPDTDVLVLCVSHYREIGCQQLWFKTGVKDRPRFIPVHDVSTNLGPEICSALPAFHALTGCDSTSAFLRIGKKKAWKVLTKSTAHQNSLSCVGQSLNIDEDIVEKIEAFVRSLYAISAKGPKTVDEARYVMFCQTSKSNMALPPTSDSLLQHTKRANYQAYVWKKALVATQRLPSPDGHDKATSAIKHLRAYQLQVL